MSLQSGGEQESFELVSGIFLRTKLAGSGGIKPTFKAAKTIHPKSKQSRGNPKPIPKELHSKTIHVLAKQPRAYDRDVDSIECQNLSKSSWPKLISC